MWPRATDKEEKTLKERSAKVGSCRRRCTLSNEPCKSRLSDYEAAFERIKNATGIAAPDEIFAKFINREEEEASLLAQKESPRSADREQHRRDAVVVELERGRKYGSTVISSRTSVRSTTPTSRPRASSS